MWVQKTIQLKEKKRGFHLVTDEILSAIPEIASIKVGQLQLLLQHTSASLTLNENCDQTVRADMEQHFLRTVPDNGVYQHDYEGVDDMPAHIKSSIIGVSLVLPLSQGKVMLGTWQGIWLGEHRFHGGGRRIIATIQGESR
ncbi:secondary thiamine-phosphate synthase enzyme YjbQ [Rosenbergiella epipactidis]|uniref:secondary thiamine-phosphate synthase enzyme YjbQ n=1 Tax=Rosenbergiella epipactidis TaxID=1544694 RepID=UPI001F4EF9F9|nr:secondary thiamine-phosphate synthase enzyme YjbQ [Rosenbergiella epipactidis]